MRQEKIDNMIRHFIVLIMTAFWALLGWSLTGVVVDYLFPNSGFAAILPVFTGGIAAVIGGGRTVKNVYGLN